VAAKEATSASVVVTLMVGIRRRSPNKLKNGTFKGVF
jgi:hypothetical protein